MIRVHAGNSWFKCAAFGDLARTGSLAFPADQRKGRLRRENGTPAARRSYHLFSRGATAPISRLASPSFLWVGSARRSGPKTQAQSAVSGALMGSGTGLQLQKRFQTRAPSPQKWVPDAPSWRDNALSRRDNALSRRWVRPPRPLLRYIIGLWAE